MSKAQSISKMILRPPQGNLNRLHPEAKKRMNVMTKTPEKLLYPLKDLSENFNIYSGPLGVNPEQQIPFNVIFFKQIMRSSFGQLPVYRTYKNNRNIKLTEIRKIEGDIDSFVKELSKIVSNAYIEVKVGRVVINGLHTESVKLWLTRMGF